MSKYTKLFVLMILSLSLLAMTIQGQEPQGEITHTAAHEVK